MLNNKIWHALKLLIVTSLFVSVFAGCAPASLASTTAEQYPLVSVNGSGSETSYVYRAADQTVPEVASALADKRKPEQISEQNNERMFLVYNNEWYHLQQDPENPEDTLVEISSVEYVRNNYSPSFLETYLIASIIGDLFDSGRSYGNYRGYTSKDTYKPKTDYRAPSADDLKKAPPVTVDRKGTILKRGNTDSSSTSSSAKSSVGSSGSIFSKGTITKNTDSSSSTKSKSSSITKKKSTPKIKVGGKGKITRRR